MAELPADPYDWTLDQVITAVAASDVPLAESLRANEVDGEVLLTVCTYERLKSDIGINPMGKRSKVMRIIGALRKRSNKYRDYILDLASNTALPEDSASGWDSPLPGAGFSTPAVQGGIGPLDIPPFRPLDIPPFRPLDIPPFSTPTNPKKRKSGVPNNPSTSLEPLWALPVTPVTGSRNKKSEPLGLLASGGDPLLVTDSASHLRDHVAVRIVKDKENGTWCTVPFSQAWDEMDDVGEIERDRLELEIGYHDRLPNPQPHSPVGGLTGNQGHDGRGTPMDTSPDPIVVGGENYESEEQDKGGNVGIDEVSDSGKEFTASPLKKTTGAPRKRRYLPPKGLTADELIYGKLEVGDEFPDEEKYDDENFIIVSTRKPPGQQRYVERQIRHLFQNPESITTVHKGHLRTGLKPYRAELVLKHYHQSIILFSVQKDGSCKVTKENTSTVNLPWNTASMTAQNSSDVQVVRFPDGSNQIQSQLNGGDNSIHDWDYLIKWQNIDDDRELPPIGDSGSENEYSLETWEELKAESGILLEKPIGKSTRKPLTTQEIQEVLKEGEKLIIDNWHKRVLPHKEAQAWRIYRVAKKRKERKKTARDARLRIKDLDERLEKMREEIVGVGWTHKAHVKKQVGILQLTVMDREEQKWIAALMERKKTPERPEKVVHVKAVLDGENEEMLDGEDSDNGDDDESLGSTSEGCTSDDGEGMEGFIVADSERDFVNGVELEVEGEKEVEEELARKAVENELIDSDGSEDNIPVRAQKPKEGRRRKDPEEGEEAEDHLMTRVEDYEEGVGGGGRIDEEIAVTPKLDKGKGKANPESPPVNVKEEPQAAHVSACSASGPYKKEIHVIDLTMDDSPEQPPKWGSRPRKALADIQQFDLQGDEEPKKIESRQELLTRMVKDTDVLLREAAWFRIRQSEPEDLFTTITTISQQLHRAKFKGVPGLDEYDSEPGEIVVERLKEDISRYNANIYRFVATVYVAWTLGITDTTKRLPTDKFKLIHIQKKFTEFRLALIESLMPYCGSEIPKEGTNGSTIPLGQSKRKKESGTGLLVEPQSVSLNDEVTTPGHRKRKPKTLVEDIQAKEIRDRLGQRMRQRADRERAEKRRARLPGGGSQNEDKIRINLGKYTRHNDIFFHDSFAKDLKQHQIEGVRFMWQQLIQTGENRGALLAHTMGLGKTVQVIALLYTIATAAGSGEKKTFEQIPKHLRTSKTLILCPPGLVENWWDEFHRWLPTKPDNHQELDLKDIGPITRADGTIKAEDRLSRIKKWYDEGGVLLMGYQAFRGFILNFPPLSDTQHNEVKKMLHDGPNIIIADEAHQLKNPTAKISDAARGFKSMSRIAMTGSPLSNNLLEYWAMIDWIDPYFLGPRKEFEQKYVQPIEDGLYADSGFAEKRNSLKILRVLKKDIGPKVHRMDISAIEQDLPAKTEFLIKVPLTELQLEMYRRFLKDPTTTGQVPGQIDIKGTSGRKFFDAIHLLSLICNHPLAFVETLEAREKDNQATDIKKPVILGDEPVDFEDLDDLLSETNKPYPWAREVMSTVEDEMGIEHSYKVLLVKVLVENAIKAKDQTLIFSHSVSTLAFLERQLKKWGTSYQKLDGRTAMNMRQAMTKKFNSGEGDVCLISTEAGGLGLNLPGANRIIIFDFKWSPMWEEQAVGRAFRLGQKKHVFVYRFHACGTYEEIMRNKVLFKNQLHSRVVDKKDPIRYATKNGKQYFNEPYDVPKQDLTPFKGMDPHVLDSVIARVNFIRVIENTETFQGDLEDKLTEEEIRESDEWLQAEQQMRKAQGDGGRKADDEYHELNTDSFKITTQFEMQIEQMKKVQELIHRRNLPAPLSPLNALCRAPTPAKALEPAAKTSAPLVKSKAPPSPPGTDTFVAPLPPTTAGRTKSVPNTAPKVIQKEKETPSSSIPPAVDRDDIPPLPNPTPKIAAPAPAMPTGSNDSPSLSDSTNKFGLNILALPKIFNGKSKRSPDNSDSPDVGGGKKAKVSSAGALKFTG